MGMMRIGLSSDEQEVYHRKKAERNKLLSNHLRQARESAKLDTCYICHKSCTSFCNSHSIPQFALKRIAADGKVYPPVWNSGLPLFDKEFGIRSAGTFQLICRECDSTEFQEYETPENYSSAPGSKVLAQICMKNYLQMVSKRRQELELYKLEKDLAKSRDVPPHQLMMLEELTDIATLDLLEYDLGFKRARQAAKSNHSDWYYPCYFRRLDYVVPFAFQGPVALLLGLDGEVINDLYNLTQSYHLQEIHIAVFPLATESIVMMIIDKRHQRYRKFYRQLKQLPLEDQLAVISHIIFLYSENVFISKNIDQSVLNNSAFLETCQTSTTVIAPLPIYGSLLGTARKAFDLSRRQAVPNLLSKQYALDS